MLIKLDCMPPDEAAAAGAVWAKADEINTENSKKNKTHPDLGATFHCMLLARRKFRGEIGGRGRKPAGDAIQPPFTGLMAMAQGLNGDGRVCGVGLERFLYFFSLKLLQYSAVAHISNELAQN
jgi:hypothetical protein